MPRWVLYDLVLVSSCGYGLWKGGAPERAAALTLVAATILTILVPSSRIIAFEHLEYGIMVVDFGVLLAMLALALLAERFWPIWMAAMAGIMVLAHISMLLKLDLMPWAYWRSEALWSYPMLLLIAVATWRHRQRLKSNGADPSWRPFFGR